MGNKHAPLGDDDIASSITLTGQHVTKTARASAHKYVASVLGHDKFSDIAVAGDTDSVVADTCIETSIGKYAVKDLYELCELRGSTSSLSTYGHEFLIPNTIIETNCVNVKNKCIKSGRISKISRRLVKKPIYRVRSTDGKYVDVTKDHSCMVMRAGNIIEVKPEEIIKTDMLVIHKAVSPA